ncbi:MAG: NAD(P)-binding domain-containing protein [Ndongobacter sp.]|nr:NAD(P)-binding domain-containing protein [Ndongobacter sp.]
MLRIQRKLHEMTQRGEKIRIGLIGCGKMGRGLVSQLQRIDGIRPSVIVDHTPEKARQTLLTLGVFPSQILMTENVEEALSFLKTDGFVVTSNEALCYLPGQIDAVVEATGIPETGARIAVEAIAHKKHIIMLNVECDSAVGPMLLKMAKEAGVVYTGTKGDEPGAIVELVDFALGAGFEVVAVGKGKNNKLCHSATLEELAEEAEARGLSAHMLCSFVDGSNTMTELTSAANALGFIPDVPGCHGLTTTPAEIADLLKRKEQGGILEKYGIVEYAFGMAPGVFAIVTSEVPEVIELMEYLGLGKGPNYTLYRPYHLTSLETPISIFDAVIEHEPSIAPVYGQISEAVAVAKRDCFANEAANGIGSNEVYGWIVSHELLQEKRLVPIALLSSKTKFRRDVKKGQWITEEDIELDETAVITKLRREQDRLGL